MVLGEYSALDGSPIEEGIVLERPARAAAPREGGAPSVLGVSSGEPSAVAAAPVAAAPVEAPGPSVTLPATGGPAGTALLGVAAAAGGLTFRALTREERSAELEEIRRPG
jgi:hypothetical protein